MSCSYQFIIAPNVIDGLRLARREAAARSGQSLALVASKESACSLPFGYHIPENYTGLAGLLAHSSDDLSVPVGGDDSPFSVVFPNQLESRGTIYSQLLDTLRPRLEKNGRVQVVLDYQTIRQTLPPMDETDEVAMFWEVREMLTEEDVAAFRYLGERIENDSPRWVPLHLYARHDPATEQLSLRVQQIRSYCGYCSDKVIFLPREPASGGF